MVMYFVAKLSKSSALLILSLAVSSAFAQGGIFDGSQTGLGSQNFGNGTNTAFGNDSINQGQKNTKEGKQNNNQGQVMQGIGQLLQGLMALAQAMADKQAASQSANTGDNSVYNPASTTVTPVAPTDPPLDLAFRTPAGQAALAALADTGTQVGTNGVTFPDGTSASWSQIGGSGSSGGLTGGGTSTAGLGHALDGVSGDSAKKSIGDGSPEGAGGGAAKDFTPQKWTFKNPFNNVPKMKKDQMLAGLSTNFSGEPIGVKGDDIFNMISRAYDRKKRNNDFIEDTSTASRQPASLPVYKSPGH